MKGALLVLGTAAFLGRADAESSQPAHVVPATKPSAPMAGDMALQKADDAYLQNLIAHQIESSNADAVYYSELAKAVDDGPWILEAKGKFGTAPVLSARALNLSNTVKDWEKNGSSAPLSQVLKFGLTVGEAYVGNKAENFEETFAVVSGGGLLGWGASKLETLEKEHNEKAMQRFIENAHQNPDQKAATIMRILKSDSGLQKIVEAPVHERLHAGIGATQEHIKEKNPDFAASERVKKLEDTLKQFTDANGQLHFDEKKLEAMLHRGLLPLNLQLEKQREQVVELTQALKEAKDKADAKEANEKDKEIERADYQRVIQGAQSTVYLASTVASLTGHSDVARHVNVVGNAAVDLCQATKSFHDNLLSASKLGSLLNDGLSSAIFAGNMLSIGLKVFGSFFGSGPPPLNQFEIIKGQLLTIRKEIAQMREHLDQQFDRIDGRINESLRHLDERFDDIEEMVKSQNHKLMDLQRAMADLRFAMSILDARMLSYVQALGHRDFVNRVDGCLNHREEWPDKPLPFSRFQDCLNASKVYAADFSTDAISNLRDQVGDFDRRDLLDDLRLQPERSLGFMALFADWLGNDKYRDSSGAGLRRYAGAPNPVEWAAGASVFMNLARQWPEYYKASSPKMLDDILSQGYRLRSFFKEVTSFEGDPQQGRQGFFADLLRYYSESVARFVETYENSKASIQVDNKTRGYDFFKDEVTKSDFNPFPGRITPCEGAKFVEGISYRYQDENRESWHSVPTMDDAGLVQMPTAPAELLKYLSPNLLALAHMNHATFKACIEKVEWRHERDEKVFYHRGYGAYPEGWGQKDQQVINLDAEGPGDMRFFMKQENFGRLVVTLRVEVGSGNQQIPQAYRTLQFQGPSMKYETILDPGDFRLLRIAAYGYPVREFKTRAEAEQVKASVCDPNLGQIKTYPGSPDDYNGDWCVIAQRNGKFYIYSVILTKLDKHHPTKALYDRAEKEAKVYQQRDRVPMREAVKADTWTLLKDVSEPKVVKAVEDLAKLEITQLFNSFRREFKGTMEASLTQGSMAADLRRVDGAALMYRRFLELGLPQTLMTDSARALVYGQDQIVGSAVLADEVRKNTSAKEIVAKAEAPLKVNEAFLKRYFARPDREAETSPFVENMLAQLETFSEESRGQEEKLNLDSVWQQLRHDVREAIAKVPKR